MCFSAGDKNNYNEPPAKPAQIPHYSPSSSKLPKKANMAFNGSSPPAGSPPSKNNPFFNNTSDNHNTGYADNPPPRPPQPLPNGYAWAQDPPKQHDWETAVPDTSLLPPPPGFFASYDHSPANNATADEADAGETFCRKNPLDHPVRLDDAAVNAISSGNINMFAPPAFRGTLSRSEPGVWNVSVPTNTADMNLTTWPPLYSHMWHHPPRTGGRRTAYFEVRIARATMAPRCPSYREEVNLALGFAASPYPSFRIPGWHRASVGVHGDDGHRYTNDRWGGKDCIVPLLGGQTVGMGMEFTLSEAGGAAVEVFVTRDGMEESRWNLHEETDSKKDLPVTGLEGLHDLYASVGVFMKSDPLLRKDWPDTKFDVIFTPEKWVWQGFKNLKEGDE